jgi:hypothetical protein
VEQETFVHFSDLPHDVEDTSGILRLKPVTEEVQRLVEHHLQRCCHGGGGERIGLRIGLLGGYGQGKTSVMWQVQRALRGRRPVPRWPLKLACQCLVAEGAGPARVHEAEESHPVEGGGGLGSVWRRAWDGLRRPRARLRTGSGGWGWPRAEDSAALRSRPDGCA